MAYTVKQVAAISRVSVRTLHFYDETGLLKPAYHGPHGYRFYEEPQLLTLQQILFYRELGFELKEVKRILGRADFEKVAALQSHRQILQKNLTRMSTLLGTIDKTIEYLKGGTQMNSGELFVGFSVGAGKDRFDDPVKIGGEPNHCKLSAQDTHGAMSVFERSGKSCGPRHLHHDQDEWIYIIDGAFEFEVNKKGFRARAGESVFLPRKVAHVWGSVGNKPGKVINTYQPAGKMEEFFREVGKFTRPQIHEVLRIDGLVRLFQAHGMDLVGPPPVGWKVDAEGRIVQETPRGRKRS
jgi:DNA-binding transcriptional MerR regulator/mannose-6-phosphate isomerase-like protein (cupin superfamily)